MPSLEFFKQSVAGVSSLMMRKVLACVSGARFLVGVPVDGLYDIMVEAAYPQASSYFGMCAFQVTLEPELLGCC